MRRLDEKGHTLRLENLPCYLIHEGEHVTGKLLLCCCWLRVKLAQNIVSMYRPVPEQLHPILSAGHDALAYHDPAALILQEELRITSNCHKFHK
jgi:hypothetical protein